MCLQKKSDPWYILWWEGYIFPFPLDFFIRYLSLTKTKSRVQDRASWGFLERWLESSERRRRASDDHERWSVQQDMMSIFHCIIITMDRRSSSLFSSSLVRMSCLVIRERGCLCACHTFFAVFPSVCFVVWMLVIRVTSFTLLTCFVWQEISFLNLSSCSSSFLVSPLSLIINDNCFIVHKQVTHCYFSLLAFVPSFCHTYFFLSERKLGLRFITRKITNDVDEEDDPTALLLSCLPSCPTVSWRWRSSHRN